MSFVELLGFLALGAIVWYWFDSLKAREIGVDAARRACAREGVQFLDETVVGQGLRLARDDDGRVVLEGREVVLVDVSAHRLARRAVVIDLHPRDPSA